MNLITLSKAKEMIEEIEAIYDGGICDEDNSGAVICKKCVKTLIDSIYNSIKDNVDCEPVKEETHAGYTFSITGRETNQERAKTKDFIKRMML